MTEKHDQTGDEQPPPVTMSVERELILRDCVATKIVGMRPKWRKMLTLIEEGFSYNEIAEALKVDRHRRPAGRRWRRRRRLHVEEESRIFLPAHADLGHCRRSIYNNNWHFN